MSKIKKQPLPEAQAVSPIHKSKKLPDDLIRFSFRHLNFENEKFNVPAQERLANYMPQFLERLRDVSGMRLSEFRANKNRALRAHTHAWDDTTEPAGFAHLNEQLQSCEPWQFCLSVNEHGRVHGLLVDDVFYVVWLDPDHKLYN